MTGQQYPAARGRSHLYAKFLLRLDPADSSSSSQRAEATDQEDSKTESLVAVVTGITTAVVLGRSLHRAGDSPFQICPRAAAGRCDRLPAHLSWFGLEQPSHLSRTVRQQTVFADVVQPSDETICSSLVVRWISFDGWAAASFYLAEPFVWCLHLLAGLCHVPP